jgi:C4-dicarboxylate-specific signal transduction histidine kinase
VAGQEHQERVKLVGALEMAGAVCHKLNQPMQVILGYSSMVSSGDVKDPEQVKAIVKTIEDETRKMGIITKNLMGITKYRSVASPGGVRMVHLGDDPAIG